MYIRCEGATRDSFSRQAQAKACCPRVAGFGCAESGEGSKAKIHPWRLLVEESGGRWFERRVDCRQPSPTKALLGRQVSERNRPYLHPTFLDFKKQ